MLTILNYMQGLKSAILAIFQKSANGLNWLCLVIPALKKPSVNSKNSFCFGFLWISGRPGWLNWKWLVSSSIRLLYTQCELLCIPTLFDICFHFPETLLTMTFWLDPSYFPLNVYAEKSVQYILNSIFK